jgi:N-acetylglucosamine malate deacetylase 1
MRVACIHAHPDDAEIFAGGTLGLLASLGHDITILTLSAGDCGSAVHEPAELSRLRQAEASASAAMIGARYRWGGFRDMAIFSDDASRRTVTGLLRDLRPEMILTAAPSDYHADHEATSQLVRDACFTASVPNYATPSRSPALSAIPHLYFVDAVDQRDRHGNPLLPDFTIDVASIFETKTAMLAQHESQRAWLLKQHGVNDYLKQMELWTRACGNRAGIELGEGFRQYRVHPFPQSPLLQELLSEFVASERQS